MKKKAFYIGNDEKSISTFTRKLNGEMEAFGLYAGILSRKQHYRDFSVLIFFYEKKILAEDIAAIAELHRAFPTGFYILVSDTLDEKEKSAYLKAGIQDTLPKEFNEERYQQMLKFFLLHQTKINNIISDPKKNDSPVSIRTFKLPLWKRAFDVLCTILAIVLLSPLLLIVSAAIRIESKGPVIYKSKRVGSNYVIFDFYKFRSMYSDAEKQLKAYSTLNQYQSDEVSVQKMTIDEKVMKNTGEKGIMVSDDFVLSEKDYISLQHNKQDNTFVKLEKDPRITKVGLFIRKYSIDELPQLINILIGDMSVVGNRPLPLYEAELLTKDEYIDRFLAPAGLTGLWQVEKRGDAGKLSAEERKKLDIMYAKEFSLIMDLKIIFRTFTAFIQKENV